MPVEHRGMRRRTFVAAVAGAVLGALAFTVPAANAADPRTLLSQHRQTLASSARSGHPAKYAVDGDTRTHWESGSKSDPQWIYVDLGAPYQVTRVRLRWAAACAKAYRVELSPDATTWVAVYSRTGFRGGTDDSTVDYPGAARYVRVFATQRCRRDDGYALNEFEVYGQKPDTSPPTAPGNLRLVQVTPISVTLAWDPSTDDVGVTGYAVFRDGSLVKQVPGDTLTATVGGLTPDTAYGLYVVASDAAGNWSPPSINLPVRTMPGEPSPPTVPRNLRVVDVTSTCVSLAWDPSADDIGVVGYDVYVDGRRYATTPVPSITICGLTPATSYTITVAARDAAGNMSQPSNAIAVTTLPA